MKIKKKNNNLPSIVLVTAIAIAAFLGGRISAKISTPLFKGKEVEGTKVVTYSPQEQEIPEVKFFVMSFCPYGNQAEAILKPVAELLGDKVDWQPVYIVSDAKKSCEFGCGQQVFNEEYCQSLIDSERLPDMKTCREYFPYDDEKVCLQKECASLEEGSFTSLHGQQELNQDVRELCVWNQGDQVKWWNFVERINQSCTYEDVDSCWEDQAVASGLDVDTIKKCEAEQASELLAKELAVTTEYKVGSSPTFIFNGEQFPPQSAYPTSQGEVVSLKIGKQVFKPEEYRSPEVLKSAICAGWEKQPKECKTKLEQVSTTSDGGC